MLHLYDLNKVKIQGLKQYKDISIESILSSGDKVLSFLLPSNLSENIKEEGYVRTKTDEFVIKEITDNKEWKSIKATLNIEALEGQPWEHFHTTEKTITECLTLALAGTGWTIGTCNIAKRRTVRKTNCSSWDIIQQAKKTYLAEMEFDTINKKINIAKKLGSDKGVYFMDSLNLKDLDMQSNSYDYYTRLIAIGKDDLKATVENYQYSNKKKTLIWKDERYTNIDSLKEDAKAKLEELSKPYKAYKTDIIDLASVSNKYSILAYGLGDTITLISKEKGIKEKQRIVKITNLIAKNIKVDNLHAKKADIDSLNAVEIRVGTLIGTKASITQLDAEVARINQAFIKTATIENLNATNGKITLLETKVGSIDTILSKEIFAELISAGKIVAGSSIIAESAVGSAQINSLDLNKLNAGSIDTSKIQLIGPNGRLKLGGNKLQIFDTVNGQQFERVMLGVDDSNNSTIVLRGADGKTILLNQDGLTKPGFTDGYNKLEDNSLPGTKLDINSVIRGMNEKGIETIKGTKVSIGDRTLDVELSTQKNLIDGANKELSTQKATINAMDNAMDNAIKLKVDNQTFTQYKSTTEGNINTVTTNLNKATSSIDVLQKSIALKVSQTDIDNSINSIEIGGRNLLNNSDFSNQYTTTATSKHNGLYATGYGGYNGGIANPLNSYHAHLDVTTFKIPVYKFNESDGTRNWKGCISNLTNIDEGEYIISFDLYATSVDSRIFGGFYYTKSGETTQGFHSGQYSVTSGEINKWIRASAKVKLGPDVNFAKPVTFYFYGYGFTSNSILYMKKPKLEKGNKATDWTPAPEDMDQAISTVDTKINTKVAEININLGGVATVRNSTAYKGDLNGKANQTALNTTESKVTQLAGLIAHKVESKDFNSYKTQTDKAIVDRVSNAQFTSYKTQTASEMAQRVSKGEFGSLFKQNGDGFNFGFQSGGTNLLRNSGVKVVTNSYHMINYILDKRISEGTTVTATIKGQLGFGRIYFGLYNSGGNINIINLLPADQKDGVYSKTFQWRIAGAANTMLTVYHMLSENTSNSTIEWITLTEGKTPMNWTPAASEFNNTSVTITNAEGLVVRNNAISVISKSGRKAFSVDDSGYIMNEWGVSTRVKPGGSIEAGNGKTIADDKCSTLLRAFGLWHESIDDKYNMRIASKSEIWFKNLADEFQDIRSRWMMCNQFRTTYNNDAGVIIRENTVDSGTGRLWLNWGGGRPGHIAQTLIRGGMLSGSYGELHCGSLYTHGTKNRAVETEHFGIRALGAYEMPTPYFGDISREVFEIIDGQCIVPLEPIFKETITNTGYQVFLTKYGPGDIWVAEMHPDFFIVKGANIKFSWELKAIQKGYENNRLEQVQI